MFFIAAPFGNYLQFENAVSVTGTFTLKPRNGRLSQILKTLRYVKSPNGFNWGWRNALGLRNPGIFKGLEKHKWHNVLSIASLEKDDWKILYSIIPKHTNIELNISCPNVYKHPPILKNFAHDKRKWCIVKVPPTISHKHLSKIVKLGYKQIHACNTFQTEKGGISGKMLVPHTMGIISFLKKEYPHVEVIAGGGVTDSYCVKQYIDAGADHISLGTVCFTPWKIKGIIL